LIKLSANLSKKVPMPDVEFSSQSYGTAMEIEVSDAADAREITGRLEAIYKLLEKSIDQQIVQASVGKASPAQPQQKRPFLGNTNGKPQAEGDNGNGSARRGDGHASPAQIKALFAISKDKGMDRNGLVELLKAEYGVERPDDLTVKAASDLIGKLQKMQGVRT
jgi:hypothetical protein